MRNPYKWFFYNNEDDFRIFKAEDMNYFAHLHRQFEILFVLSGQLCLVINHTHYHLFPGDLAIVSPNQIHSYTSTGENQLYIMIFESQIAAGFANFFTNQKLSKPVLSLRDQSVDCGALFEKIHTAVLAGANSLVVSGYIHLALGAILPHLTFCPDQGCESASLQKILLYVQRYYNKKITLSILARETGVTRYHISRIFNHKIGISFSDYVKAIRIANATRLLSTDMSIIQIALESGFENIRSFYRAFHETHQTSPQKFRKENYQSSL